MATKKRGSVLVCFSVWIISVIFVGMNVYAGEPVEGFADFHIHQMAEYAYAGAWYHGSHQGAESSALSKCTGGSIFGGDHARTIFGPLNEFLGKVPGSDGDTGWHFYKKYGYPDYTGWPRWDTIAHHQVWEGHLQQAHEAGLNLYMMSAVNFRPLCEVMPDKNRMPGLSCEDMASVDVQLQAALNFADQRDWVEIAESPEDARAIIHSGKLAMVLAIEVSELFVEGDWEEHLDFYYDNYKVRSIQFGHQMDNRFTGVAPHHFVFDLFQFLEDLRNGDDQLGFDLDENGKNSRGLTDEGKAMAQKMIEKNMIIDLAHVSEQSVSDVYNIVAENEYYPFNVSHGHLRSIMMDEKQEEEKTTSDETIGLIRKTGGVFGLRSGAEQVKTYTQSGVANNCDGSTKSFAQAYQYAVKGLKVNVTFASDFNGFIQQLRPRFGGSKETCGASGSRSTRNAQQDMQTNILGTEFDFQGFGHIGLEGDVIADLKNMGVDTSDLENSAETFIQMWERCYDTNRAGPLSTVDMDTTGIE